MTQNRDYDLRAQLPDQTNQRSSAVTHASTIQMHDLYVVRNIAGKNRVSRIEDRQEDRESTPIQMTHDGQNNPFCAASVQVGQHK